VSVFPVERLIHLLHIGPDHLRGGGEMTDLEVLRQFEDQTSYNHQAVKRYFEAPLPSEHDSIFSHLCSIYRMANKETRCSVSMRFDEGRAAWLNVFAYRMSMLARRSQDQMMLGDALTALLIIAHRDDRYGWLMTLSLAYRSAESLEGALGLFEQTARYACDTESAQLLLGFLVRASQEKRIEAMGFREVVGRNGIVYLRLGQVAPEAW
jgi:hypothetical protein